MGEYFGYMIAVFLITNLSSACFSSSLASKKGYSGGLHFVLGLLFGITELLYAIGLPLSRDEDAARSAQYPLITPEAEEKRPEYQSNTGRVSAAPAPSRNEEPKPPAQDEAATWECGHPHYKGRMSDYDGVCPVCKTKYYTNRRDCIKCGAIFDGEPVKEDTSTNA